MNHHPRTVLSLVALAATLFASPALAQEPILDEATARKLRQSHASLGLESTDPAQMQKILSQRLRRAQDLAGLQKLIDDIRNNPDKYGVKEMVEQLKKDAVKNGRTGLPDLKDPKWSKLVEDVLEKQGDNPNLKISPEQLEEWKKLLPKQTDPDKDPRDPSKPPPMEDPDGPGAKPPAVATPPGIPQGASADLDAKEPPALPEPSEFQKWLARESVEAAKWMRNRDWVQNNPAMQKALRDFSRSILSREGGWPHSGAQAKGLRERLPALDSVLPKGDQIRRWKLPDLPNIRTDGGGFRVGPDVGRPELPSASTWEGLLWIAVTVCFALAAWRLLAWRQAVLAARQNEWRLGPWPVRPSAIRTREDLVKGFEYLSLLLLGRPAFHWNHLEIGSRLASDPRQASSDRQRAVWNLAGLYEQARYAPPHDLLPPAEIAAARRDLCLLAGVAA